MCDEGSSRATRYSAATMVLIFTREYTLASWLDRQQAVKSENPAYQLTAVVESSDELPGKKEVSYQLVKKDAHTQFGPIICEQPRVVARPS